MKSIQTTLREEKKQLREILKQAQRRLKTAPKGQLRIAVKHNSVEYYYKDAEISNKNGRYMKKNEMNMIKKLAQRDYDKQVVKNTEEKIKVIDRFLSKYDKTGLKELYQRTSPQRLNLIGPVMVSDEEYIRQWQSVEYMGKWFAEDCVEIITEKGEKVRSKSEKIIADKLFALKIPYRYEYPLILKENRKIYPDFTILKMPEREEVYLEHLGMMDDIGYVEKTMTKLNTYGKNGIYVGVNLFITYESSKIPLDTRALDGLLKAYFT